jgi:hypothetical protein
MNCSKERQGGSSEASKSWVSWDSSRNEGSNEGISVLLVMEYMGYPDIRTSGRSRPGGSGGGGGGGYAPSHRNEGSKEGISVLFVCSLVLFRLFFPDL